MSEERASNGSSASSYFLVGLGLGSLISAVFAPKSGAKTRGYLSDNKLKEGSELDKHDVRKKEQITAAVAVGREIYKQEIAKAKAARAETE